MTFKWYLPSVLSSRGGGIDTSAAAFIAAAGLTDETQIMELNRLVVNAKAHRWWYQAAAIWPFIGGSAASHKYNLIDPRDLDAAFRLTFSGSWVHSATGALPDGSTAFAQTHFVPSTGGILLNDNAFGAYSRTAAAGSASEYLMGAGNSATQNWAIAARRSANQYFGIDMTSGTGGTVTGTDTDGSGFWLNSRISISSFTLYRNAGVVQTNGFTNVGTLIPTVQMYIGANNVAGVTTGFGSKEIAFAVVFLNGLSSALQSAVYTDIQAFQTALGRQV